MIRQTSMIRKSFLIRESLLILIKIRIKFKIDSRLTNQKFLIRDKLYPVLDEYFRVLSST